MRFPGILFFSLVNLFNYLDRYLVAGILPLIMADYGMSYSDGGLLFSAFVLGYVIFSPLFGYLGDRHSRIKLMALGVLLWSLATMASAAALPLILFLGVRVMVGVGEASFGSIAPGYLKDRLNDPRKLQFALSIFFCAIPIGSALGYVCGGFIASKLSWHYAFILCGLPGLLLALGLLFFKDDRIVVAPPPNLLRGVAEICAIPCLVCAMLGYACNSFALNGIATFVTKYGESLGFANSSITVIFGGILVVTGFAGTMIGGKLSEMYAERCADPMAAMLRFIGVVSFIATPCVIGAFLASQAWLFLTLCFFAELFIFATVTPVNAVLVRAAPPSLLTFTQGASILVLNLFGALPGPRLVGMLADRTSLGIGMQLSSLALFLSGVVWLGGGIMIARKKA